MADSAPMKQFGPRRRGERAEERREGKRDNKSEERRERRPRTALDSYSRKR